MVMRQLCRRRVVQVQGGVFVMVMRHRLQVNQLVRQALHRRLLRTRNGPDPPKRDEHEGKQVAANR